MDTQACLNLRKEATVIIDEAAVFMRKYFGNITVSDIEVKGHNSLVSHVDKGAEEILVAGLKKLLPAAGFITEEETIAQEKKSLTWIIDPLDGTTNYLHGIPHFSISVALFDNNKVVLGMIKNVMTDELYWAVAGGGAYKDMQPISVTSEPLFSETLIGTGFPYKQDQTVSGHFAALQNILHSTRGIRRFGSAALDLCSVAIGQFGAFYEHTLNSYDIAAGALIVQEAGGYISDYQGGDNWLFEGEILASAPQFQARMIDVLKAFST